MRFKKNEVINTVWEIYDEIDNVNAIGTFLSSLSQKFNFDELPRKQEIERTQLTVYTLRVCSEYVRQTTSHLETIIKRLERELENLEDNKQ